MVIFQNGSMNHFAFTARFECATKEGVRGAAF